MKTSVELEEHLHVIIFFSLHIFSEMTERILLIFQEHLRYEVDPRRSFKHQSNYPFLRKKLLEFEKLPFVALLEC